MRILKVGDEIRYERRLNSGEKITQIAIVVAIFMGMALLDNGDEIFAIQ